jgi:ribosomal protein S18 acetylase RimI-like enzyme
MFQIRRARPDDLQVILNLINEASDWLRTKDTDQWSKPWPSEAGRDARVIRGLADGKTWLVEDRTADGVTPVATITYRAEGNDDLWREEELSVPACYVSRLVVSRKYAGQQIGTSLVEWAAIRAKNEYQAQFVRIDVWTSNNSLHNYYEKRGFGFLRFCEDVHYPSAALFQKPMSAVDETWRTLFHEEQSIGTSRLSALLKSGVVDPRARLNRGARRRHQPRIPVHGRYSDDRCRRASTNPIAPTSHMNFSSYWTPLTFLATVLNLRINSRSDNSG